LPSSADSLVAEGALGIAIGCGTLSGFENSGEKLVMYYARFDTS